MLQEIEKWTTFAKDVITDERIPARNKAVAGAMLTWVLLPFDLVPDYIPLLGMVDDVILLTLLVDYLLNEIPMEVLVDHYPGSAISLLRMRRKTRQIRRYIPDWVTHAIWK